MSVAIRRAYEAPADADGRRYLVDRLWPRGRRADELALTGWPKELAPSDDLRRRYGRRPERFEEFRRRYRDELRRQRASLAELVERARQGPVILVFAARDAERSNAAALADLIREAIPCRRPVGRKVGPPRTRASAARPTGRAGRPPG